MPIIKGTSSCTVPLLLLLLLVTNFEHGVNAFVATNFHNQALSQVWTLDPRVQRLQSSSSDDDKLIHSSAINKDNVQNLLDQAKKMKLEAKKLELEMTLDKITKLQRQLDTLISSGDDRKKVIDIESEIQLLEIKLEAIETGKKVALPVKKVSKTVDTDKKTNILTNDLVGKSPIPVMLDVIEKAAASSVSDKDNISNPLTESQLKSAVESFQMLPRYMRKRLADAVKLYEGNDLYSIDEDTFNTTEVVLLLYNDRQRLLADGFFDQSNKQRIQVEVVKKGSSGNTNQSVNISVDSTEELLDYLTQMESELGSDEARRERFVTSIFPDATRKNNAMEPTEEEAQLFLETVLSSKTYNPTSKPEKIPGGYLIRGTNKMKSNDEMINAVESALSKSPLVDKLQFFYVRDPYPSDQDDPSQVDFENIWGEPVMVLFNKDVSPERNGYVATLTTIITLLCVGIFSLETFNDTPAIVSKIENAYNAGDYDLTWLTPSVTPIFFSILATQLCHEIAHQLFALKGKFKTCAPTFIPSPTIPLITSVTKLRTPARNLRDLFDFALSGPLTGMLASAGLLVFGIVQTNTMDQASYALLPTLPVDFIKASSLGGNIINSLMNDQILTLQDKDAVPLHPFAIAGFCGLMINALSLLPIGQSDGGRIAMAVFGRNGIVLAQAAAFLYIFGSALVGYDPINILIVYGFFSIFAQSEQELPCLNELDDLDLGRSFLAIFGSIIVALTLIPII